VATTSGLIQRLKWVAASRAVFVYVGPTSSSVQLFVLMFDDSDPAVLASRRAMSHLLARAQSAGLPASLFHDTGSTIITGVDVQFALIRVDGVEMTQSIQNLSNTVPLIAAKATVARVYLSSRLPAPTTVRGTLRIRRDGTPDSLVPSLNEVVLDPAEFGQIGVQRNDAAKSLNFLFPPNQTVAGSADVTLVRLEEAATGVPQNVAPPGALDTAVFSNSPPLRLGLIGFSYEFGTPPQTFTPSADDFGLILSWLQRAYPVALVIATQRVVAANTSAPFTCGAINSQLAAIRALDVSAGADSRTHYYGVVSDGGFFMRGCAGVPSSPNPAAVGSGPTGPATWGWDFDGSYGDWYGGHELGHTFGRRHPGFCGESDDDPNYPFDGGQLSNADGAFAGFDVGDAVYALAMTALPGVDWHDVMTYCIRQWLSSYTYAGIRERLTAEDALGSGAGAGSGRPDERFPEGFGPETAPSPPRRRNLVSIVAQVNLTKGTGQIDYVNPVTRGEVSPQDATGPVVIRTKNGDGEVLDEFRVGVTPVAQEAPGEDSHALCDVVIAAHPDAITIELLVHDQLADTFRAGAAPLPIGELRVERGPQEVVLSGDRGTALRPGLFYNVQLSSDGGRSWQTVAVGEQSPRVAIHSSNLPEDRPVLVRVQASDGFHASETVVELEPG
jgi:hypothetical protein